MHALIVKNVSGEGPGTIEDHLCKERIPYSVNQAFRYGDRAYGLQFHIEVTPAIVRGWLVHEQGIDYASISADSERLFASYRQRAMKFYGLFFEK